MLAYSGGVDSQALLHLFSDLGAGSKFKFQAIHVNHGIHPHADSWADFCKRTCDSLGLELVTETVKVRKNRHGLEAAAREARYQALASHVSTSEHVLFTAHHQDDQAETLVLHLVRGSGVSGLAAMPEQRQIGSGILCRPLLNVGRDRIYEYARYHRLEWIEDESNTDPEIRRSFLRSRIFPELRQHWPNVTASLARTAGHMAEADKLLADIATLDMQSCLNSSKTALLVSGLSKLSSERLRNLLRYRIRCCGLNMPSTNQLVQVEKLVNKKTRTAHAEIVWGDNWCRLYRDEVWFGVADAPVDRTKEYSWTPGHTHRIRLGNYCLMASDVIGDGLSKQRTGPNLLIRFRQGGERCQLPGREHRTTLKNLFQQAGVPPWERKTMPLIYAGEQLAAVGDRWICGPFAARADEPAWSLSLQKLPEN